MKNTMQPVIKYVNQLDKELKNILNADLKAFKSKNDNVRQLISVFTITAA